jgi:hypothetical protein
VEGQQQNRSITHFLKDVTNYIVTSIGKENTEKENNIFIYNKFV